MTTLAPTRSHEQRTQALRKANEIRFRRARLKREISSLRQSEGLARVAEVILDPPPELDTMRVLELLTAVWGVGQTKAAAAFTRTRMSHSKTIGGLSKRQRYELVLCLDERRALTESEGR
jgi:hypothetical protein